MSIYWKFHPYSVKYRWFVKKICLIEQSENLALSFKYSTEKWAIKQINPEFTPKAQMTRIKLLRFMHIVERPSSLEQPVKLGKVKGKRIRG